MGNWAISNLKNKCGGFSYEVKVPKKIDILNSPLHDSSTNASGYSSDFEKEISE